MGCSCSANFSRIHTTSNMINDPCSNYKAANNTKILVLGTSNSGKSTLLRQMQIINTSGFSKAERESFRPLIQLNIIDCTEIILKKHDMQRSDPGDLDMEKCIIDFQKLAANGVCHIAGAQQQLLQLALQVWSMPEMKELFSLYASEFESPASLAYLLDNLEDIAREDFLPTDQQILHCRMRTTGVRTLQFYFEDIPIEMIDVGGQRSERRKWIHQFDDVAVILFCVSVNEFDMPLREDTSKNAMMESLQVFKSVINSYWFKQKPIAVFLNKSDLLEEKVRQSPISDYFKDFEGDPDSYSDVINFIREKYIDCNEQNARQMYAFSTCATDTSNIERVSNVCFHTIFRQTLTLMGLD
eukprot:Seg2347.8 transcript_id=Seg2347.8/GoldUCD/mRNA.D3Y31 product="Guanine nucleotide-binding protein alpha-2 subunit" protein_id=Seg2347.8/GoldUCD/D3Y31